MRDGRYSQTERDEMRRDEMRCLQQQPSLVKIDVELIVVLLLLIKH